MTNSRKNKFMHHIWLTKEEEKELLELLNKGINPTNLMLLMIQIKEQGYFYK